MKKFTNKFFRRNCYLKCELLNYGIELNNEYEKQLRQSREKEEIYLNLKKIINSEENILSIVEKSDEDIIVTVEYEYKISSEFITGMNFYAYVYENQSYKRKMRLTTEVRSFNENLVNIYIVDFIGKENCGYGTIVMNAFFKHLKLFHVNKVYGFLSWVDYNHSEEHKNLLFHFYKKFGFTITEDYKLYLYLKRDSL